MTRSGGTRHSTARTATLDHERSLWATGGLLAGMDEVGRGALAGPVSVGVAIVSDTCGPVPVGLTDSKLVAPHRRTELVPLVEGWALATAVGHTSPAEVDLLGIVGALRRAGRRALAEVEAVVGPVPLVLLDGSQDWLSTPAANLFDALDGESGGQPGDDEPTWSGPAVVTRVKADITCASVAAASILAKCARDALLVALAHEHPEYGWDSNKGYGTGAHRDALARLGATDHHRRSWHLFDAFPVPT